MLRKLFFVSLALVSACSITTDLDGLSGGPLSTDASDGGREAGNLEPPVEAGPVCTAGQDFSADPKNCGACGHDCLGGQCFQSVCQPLLLASAATAHIKVDATHLYLADKNRRVITRVPKRGGAEETLASGQDGLYEFDINDTHVFFMSTYGVRRVAKTGGTVQDLIKTTEVRYIRVVGEDLYWSGWNSSSSPSSLHRAALDGTGDTAIVKDKLGIETIDRDGDLLFYGENGQQDSSGPGSVHALDVSSGQDNALVNQKCRRLAVDATTVYFLDYYSPTVWSVPRNGGASQVLASSMNNTFAGDIVVDDRFVYWSVDNTGATGGVLRVAKTGGTVTPITTVQQGVGVAVDDAAVYWSHKAGGVYLLAKPLD